MISVRQRGQQQFHEAESILTRHRAFLTLMVTSLASPGRRATAPRSALTPALRPGHEHLNEQRVPGLAGSGSIDHRRVDAAAGGASTSRPTITPLCST